MIVYRSTKQGFIDDVNNYPIEDVILKKFESELKRTTGEREIESWRNSLPYMSQVLSHDSIPNDAGVLIEYMIPQSAFRVDFIITGMSESNEENVVIVELKQWSESQMTDKDGIVKTRLKVDSKKQVIHLIRHGRMLHFSVVSTRPSTLKTSI